MINFNVKQINIEYYYNLLIFHDLSKITFVLYYNYLSLMPDGHYYII